MPTYEYACKGCGEHLEVVQSFRDEALSTCPNCGGELRKVFGAIGIAFKGSGFYKTDSRESSGTKARAKGDGKEKAEPASTSKKSDTGGGGSTSASGAGKDASGSGSGSGKGDSPKAAASS